MHTRIHTLILHRETAQGDCQLTRIYVKRKTPLAQFTKYCTFSSWKRGLERPSSAWDTHQVIAHLSCKRRLEVLCHRFPASAQREVRSGNPSAQALGLAASFEWMKADPQICCRSWREGRLPQELPQLSYSLRSQLTLRTTRYNLKLFANKPSIRTEAANLPAARGRLLRGNRAPVCHVALHFPANPTGHYS